MATKPESPLAALLGSLIGVAFFVVVLFFIAVVSAGIVVTVRGVL